MVNISINFMSWLTLTPSTSVLSIVLFGDLVPCAEAASRPSGLLVSSLSEMETWEDPQDPPLAALCLSTLDTKTHTSCYINLQTVSYSWNLHLKHICLQQHPTHSDHYYLIFFNVQLLLLLLHPTAGKTIQNMQFILTATCVLWRTLWCPIIR